MRRTEKPPKNRKLFFTHNSPTIYPQDFVGFKIAPALQLAEIAVGSCTFRFFGRFPTVIFLSLACEIG